MCAIFGFIDSTLGSEQVRLNLLKSASDCLRHRGPDDEGYAYFPLGAFGHRRLAIIDLQSGAQPMVSSDGRYTLVFNGEIYNFMEIKDELMSLGARFQTNSDTEVLLVGYITWGFDVVKKLNGMFAFSIWDSGTETLFAARDPFGQKPFFYWAQDKSFYFGSELRIFSNWSHLGIEPDLDQIGLFLKYESFLDRSTAYKNVYKLRPGHYLTFAKGILNEENYFQSVPGHAKEPLENVVNHTDSLLRQAVERTFVADVPVALMLSGGLDSSLICSIARGVFGDRKLKAFHISNYEESFNETPYARQVAHVAGIELEEVPLGLATLAALAKEVPGLVDEPIADPGILPKFHLCRRIQKDFKVALTGDGGDEIFYGYLIMKAERMALWIPPFLRRGIRWCLLMLSRILPATYGYMGFRFMAQYFAKGLGASDWQRSTSWMSSFSDIELKKLLKKPISANAARSAETFLQKYFSKPSRVGNLANRMQHTYLPDYVLVNSDRASMLNSLETRAPFLDLDLVRYVNQLDDGIKFPGLQLKYLLKKLARRYLPNSVIYRKKMGFTAPIAHLLRADLADHFSDVFNAKKIEEQGLFNSEYIQELWLKHRSGQENLYKPLWTLYSLQVWLDSNLKKESP